MLHLMLSVVLPGAVNDGSRLGDPDGFLGSNTEHAAVGMLTFDRRF